MKNYYFVLVILTFTINAQQVTINWQDVYGGEGSEISYAHTLTTDGGRIIAGSSSTESNGESDFWIFKTDEDGEIIWEKKYGGSNNDIIYDIKQTADGGYIVAGSTYSNNGDVIGSHGTSDAWILKLDNEGEIEWQKTLGGQSLDEARSILETNNGDFVIAATSRSDDGNLTNNSGYEDFWVIRLSASGDIVWNKVYGGSNSERAYTIEERINGGFIVGGLSSSVDGDISAHHGDENEPDGWIISIDENGVLEWEKSFGGTSYDRITSIKKTLDGGYIMAAETAATDGDVTVPIQGQSDAWLVKIDSEGNIQWQKSYGGAEVDYGTSVIQTDDSSFLFAVNTFSIDGDSSTSNGNLEGLIIKTDNIGELQWKKTLGGSQEDSSNCVSQLPDGRYLISGGTHSSDGDITSMPSGYDAWVAILDSENLSTVVTTRPEPFVLYPNPCTDILELQYGTDILITKIVIFDTLGKIVAEHQGAINSINTSSLQKGVYFIKASTDTAEYNLKFIRI